jgi:methanogenic corrinoid protein MtbC1
VPASAVDSTPIQQHPGTVSHEAQLTQFIRRQVIPRLAEAHGLSDPARPGPVVVSGPTAPELHAFTKFVMREDATAVVAHIEKLVARGIELDAVYLEWIAPAARQMGCDWESDECDFSAVTIGMWTLQKVLHALSPAFLKDSAVTRAPRRVLLVSVPGEQHTMGLFMMSEFFRRAGWDVWSELPSDYADVIDRASEEWFDLIGLSVGSDQKLEALSSAIVSVRRASRNAETLIMVGGPIVAASPEIAVSMGADFAATDARQTLVAAEQAVMSRLSEQFGR